MSADALEASKLAIPAEFKPTYFEFSPTARRQVSMANVKVDKDTHGGKDPGTEHQHFDNSLLHEGADHLLRLRKNIMNLLSYSEDVMNGTIPSSQRVTDFNHAVWSARELLGSAHHTIQDFYAHSNWIESHPNGIARMLWIGKDKQNTFIDVPSLCEKCGGTPVNSGGLFSGTYRSPEFEMTREVLRNRQICIHGVGETSADPPVSLPTECPGDELPGIAKDSRSGPYYKTASDRAIVATAAFTRGILVDALDQGYYVAVCGFLGYTNGFSCLNKQTETKEFNFDWKEFATGSYKTDEIFTWEVPKFDANKGLIRSIATRWEWEVDGEASCPQDPSTAIPGANICLALRRFANMTISSPDLSIAPLYCNTSPDLSSNTCGLNAMFPDNFGFSYIVWPGGDHDIILDENFWPPLELHYISTDLTAFTTKSAGETFTLDGSFVSRLLFNLGVDNGAGREPSTYIGSGGYLQFSGQMKVKITITYEYVPKQQ